MAFPKSQRFVEKETCAPPPTAYHLPSTFDENNCSAWVRPCTFDHQCNQCLANGKSHDHSGHSNKYNETTQATSCTKKLSCASSSIPDTKENACCIQKKDVSNIPRYKKNTIFKLTEPKAPSFMTRPRHSVHNCFTNIAGETQTSYSTTSFNRHSLKRKSIKFPRDNKHKTTGNIDNTLSPFRVLMNPSLHDNRHLNVSYVVCDKPNDKLKNEVKASEISPASSTGAVSRRLSNITDDMKESGSFQSLNKSFIEDIVYANPKSEGSAERNLLKNDDLLNKEILNNSHDAKPNKYNSKNLKGMASDTIKSSEVENEFKNNKGTKRKETCLNFHDISYDKDNQLTFLIKDEFIDDEYDSYINDSTLEKLSKMEITNLFEVLESLILMYKMKLSIALPKRKVKSEVKRQGSAEVIKNKNKKIIKNKKHNTNNINLWSELEKIVRSAITELKGEFKNEIYRKTEEKVDTVMAELAKVLLKAENGIENSCERTTVALINKLQKMVNN